MNYDVVVGIGCSFMNGDAIHNSQGRVCGKDYVAALLLSKKLKTDYVHLAGSGFSNERIFRLIYEWIENNNEKGYYEKPLFIIGLTDTSRYHFQNIFNKEYFDLQPGHLASYDDEALSGVNKKLTNGVDSVDDLRTWMSYYMKWLYNDEHEDKKLQREIMMLHHYLKSNNCDYRIHNSLRDSLGDTKHKINYITFQDDDYKGDDTWVGYLRYQLEEVDGLIYNDIRNRNHQPPYGKRFCKGHPSPHSYKKLFERIYEDLKNETL